MPSPSLDFQENVRSTSGDEGKTTFSGRPAVAKVALAGDAGKLAHRVVMQVSREYAHEKLEKVVEVFVVLRWVKAHVLIMVRIDILLHEWVPVRVRVVSAMH